MADFKKAFAPDILDQINASTEAYNAALALKARDVSPVLPDWARLPVEVDAYRALVSDPFAAATDRLHRSFSRNVDATRDPRSTRELDPAAEAAAAREAAARRLSAVMNPRRPSEMSPELTSKLAAAGASAVDPFGIPSWAVGLVSRGAKEAWRGTYENEPVAAILGSLATPSAAVTAPLRALTTTGGAVIKSAPAWATTALAGGLALAPSEAGSQKQQVPTQDEQEKVLQMRQQETLRPPDQETKKLYTPFREEHPNWTFSMEYGPGAAALLATLAARGWGREAANKFVRDWETTIAKIKDPKLRAPAENRAVLEAELAGRAAEAPQRMAQPKHWAVPAGFAPLAIETSQMPEQFDYGKLRSLPDDDPRKIAAWNRLWNSDAAFGVGKALAAVGGFGTLGAKVPFKPPNAPPSAATDALLEWARMRGNKLLPP